MKEKSYGIIKNSWFVTIRDKPSLESKIIHVLKKEDNVEIIDKVEYDGNIYCKVKSLNNHVGYIRSKYVEEVPV